MRLPLLREIVILSVAFQTVLAAPSLGDWISRQQGRPALEDGQLFRRDNDTGLAYSNTTTLSTASTTNTSVITLITPSPGAPAISITSQGQTITSYSPLTVCPLVVPSTTPSAISSFAPAIPSASASASANASSPVFNTTNRFARRQISPPSVNTTPTISAPLNTEAQTPTCYVHYVPITTPICHTTLTPLGGLPIPITDCGQEITFSTDHGVASTMGAAAELVTTYYVAPWQAVVTGVPTGTVDAEICNASGQCSTQQEIWSVSTATSTATEPHTLSVNTVVTGPALVILDPTSTLTLTDSTPSTISTSLTYETYPTSTSLVIVIHTVAATTAAQTSSEPPSTITSSSDSPSTITSTDTSTMTVTVQSVTVTSTL
ncbi:hypothetical protein MMC08_006571 [Hypocenomyce scalaris]|nr:hypothetical protein [Hypocenomyce scalaris]